MADLHHEQLDLPIKPVMYASHRQRPWEQTMNIVVRTSGDPMTSMRAE